MTSVIVLVFGRRQQGGSARSTDRRPKSAKARSRGKLGKSSGRYEGLHTGELKIVQWTSRQAREVQQWTASELIDGYRFEGRQPGKTLPQLPRFGMSVAQEYF